MSKLFYVIGPSGAGKDTLMLAARQALAGQQVLFAHRYVTRALDAGGENYISLSEAEFALRQQEKLFWLVWQSHGLSYGVGQEVVSWLKQGLSVVVNGSRGYLPQAQAMAKQADVVLVPIWIHCDTPVLAQRLAQRGRETAAEIEERLVRADAFPPPQGAVVIDNSGSLEKAVEQLLHCLRAVE